MSSSTVRASREIFENLMKSKGVSRDVIMNLDRADSQATRLLSTVSQLARGDITNLVTYLAQLGPYGVYAAIAIAAAAVGYGIYQQATKERPSEVYLWRYPE